jgi:hypothetical protein
MEFAKGEISAIQHAVNEIAQKEILDLSELHLALIGGGIGDVIIG